jgi:transcriptional regulator with XRE-family HTH domain
MTSKEYSSVAVGARLRKMREAAKLTQQQAAESLSVSNQSVCNWERGRNDISLRNAHELTRLYKVYSLDELTKEEDKEV